MAGVFRDAAERAGPGAAGGLRVLPVPNRLFGAEVTAAGLMTGRDAVDALRASGPFDAVLLPSTTLNGDGVFIDDVTREEVERAAGSARVLFADSFSDALAA
jgi:NifB/MoaA-like Fe-S oxidoreductase